MALLSRLTGPEEKDTSAARLRGESGSSKVGPGLYAARV